MFMFRKYRLICNEKKKKKKYEECEKTSARNKFAIKRS